MEIESISNTQLLSVADLTNSQSFSMSGYLHGYLDGSDGEVLDDSNAAFSALVKEACAMPEIRGDVVDYFKALIRSGRYPSEATVTALTHRVGSVIAPLLDSGSAWRNIS